MSSAHQPVGSAADEASRLVQALSGWWSTQQAHHHRAGPATAAPEAADADADADASQPPSACQYCPWCRAVAAAQQVSPEVVDQLLGAAQSFAAALRELSREVSGAGAPSRTADHPAERPQAPRTVSIPVEPDDEAQGEG